MVARTALTDLKLRSLPLPQKGQACYWDTLPGFGVRVSQGGARTFLLKHKNRFITLGRYHPDIFPLAKAREEAKRILAEFTLGKVRPQSITYEQAVKLFIEEKKRGRRGSTADGYEWLLNLLGLRGQLADVTHGDITRSLARIKSRSTYDHALVAARIFFNWALKRRYVSENPTFGLSAHGTPKRSRTLATDEIRAIWETCSDLDNDLPAPYRIVVKLLICLGCRRGEAAALRWSWIGEDRISWPPEVMKNGKSHWLPLLTFTKSVLATVFRRGDLLFPARGKDTPFNGWSKSFDALKELSGVQNFTLHDIHRSWASANAAWAAPHILERALGHVSGTISGVAAVYNRFQYEKELTACYQQWETHLKKLLDLA